MRRLRRAVVVVGEGTWVGLLIGAVFGCWKIWLNSDLEHRMFWLAAIRLDEPMVAFSGLGALTSVLFAIPLVGLARRGRRPLWIGIVGLGLLWCAGLVAIAFPFRETVFPLHQFSTYGQTRTIFALVAAASFLLLAIRARDALKPAIAVPARSGGVRFALGSLAVWVAVLAILFWVVHPRLASARARGRPSLVLVSIDTLRADRVGALGAVRSRTPHLDALAAEGTIFEQATSAAPWTLPSHAALFASVLPFDQIGHWDFNREIPLHEILLAEQFREAGYRTAAFTGGGYVSWRYGFGQGFEVYEDHDEEVEGGAHKIVASARAWVEAHRGEPYFLFVHTYEAHYPYVHREFADPRDAGRLPTVITTKETDAMHHGDLVLTGAERRYVTDLYDGDVAEADRVIGGFLHDLKQEGILDRALVVVLSDHGEELWDREPDYSPDHGHSLYQELLHVPLLVRWPGRVAAGARIKTPVSLLDVAPTLLDLAGLPAVPAHQGRSLAKSLLTGEEPAPRALMAESVQYGPDRFMLREGSVKSILTPYPDRLDNSVPIPARHLEVFDLAADPLERHDLSARLTKSEARMVDTLWRRAQRVLNQPGSKEEQGPPLPEDLLQQLRSLGYLH